MTERLPVSISNQQEVERKQGQISQTEYQKAKTALDQTLARALEREAQQA